VINKLENVEYFNNFGNLITNDDTSTREIKYTVSKTKAVFNKKTPFQQQTGLKEETRKTLYLKYSFV